MNILFNIFILSQYLFNNLAYNFIKYIYNFFLYKFLYILYYNKCKFNYKLLNIYLNIKIYI